MKKSMFIAALFIAATSFGQSKQDTAVKKDTTIQILLPINTYRAVIYTIDKNIDSKSLTKELIELLQKSATIFEPKKQK